MAKSMDIKVTFITSDGDTHSATVEAWNHNPAMAFRKQLHVSSARILTLEPSSKLRMSRWEQKEPISKGARLMCKKTPSIGIHDCCEILRSNGIEKSESTLSAQIQAGLFPSWSVPSAGTKRAAPDISRARFIRWMKEFYELEEVYGV